MGIYRANGSNVYSASEDLTVTERDLTVTYNFDNASKLYQPVAAGTTLTSSSVVTDLSDDDDDNKDKLVRIIVPTSLGLVLVALVTAIIFYKKWLCFKGCLNADDENKMDKLEEAESDDKEGKGLKNDVETPAMSLRDIEIADKAEDMTAVMH